MAKKPISLNECYKTLQISKGASMDEVKQAYRKLAFALHPDRNPNNPKAVESFQQVKEAYEFILSNINAETNKAKAAEDLKKSKEKAAQEQKKAREMANKKQAFEEEQRRKERLAQKEKERAERLERERLLDERRRIKERQEREYQERNRLHEQMKRTEVERKLKADKEKAEALRREIEHKERLLKQMQEEKDRNQNYKKRAAAYSKQGKPIFENFFSSKKETSEFDLEFIKYAESMIGDLQKKQPHKSKEDLLHDLLEDEQTRIVYEKMKKQYGETKSLTNEESVERNSFWSKPVDNVQNSESESSNEPKQVNAVLQNVKEQTEHITSGIKQGLSGWFKNQIDEELEMYFPASKLVAGAKMRLQIRAGWSGELQTIEVTLPMDFVPGKPLCLKGMGKKIGKWQGDLYLKLQIR